MRKALFWWSIVWLVLAIAPVRGQSDAKVPDPDPELERKTFQVAEGFEVNLFAADPLLAKPIQMNFDPVGRLWVACSSVYPHIKPGEQANDKIIILEDTTGRGRADKTTVFADGLLIPTGVAPGDGGAYVANSTELLHFADTRGTGHADRRRVVLSGFGTEDTHHILHTLRWGPDGMLYFNQSVYIHSHIETPHGVRRLNGGGIWQFRPETMELEVFMRGFVNTWGHHFDHWGQSFVTDGAYGEGINYGMPGAYYFWAVGAVRILEGLNPGSPKHCGAEIVSGRHLPPDWQGNILTNDFRGHRVCRFVLSENGSGYTSQEKPEVIKTTHGAFRPIDIKMGPDGAIYIADWYNPIIQHGEVDFRDPRRDHTHGRIWRVTAKGRPLVQRPSLVGATTEALLKALKAPEDWTRQQAKRVLKERGTSVLPILATWVNKLGADPGKEPYLLEALWTYQSLDLQEPKLLERLLSAQDHHVRAAAIRVLSAWHGHLPNALKLLSARVQDPHPQVRLEAVGGLGKIHDVRAAAAALRALDLPMDKYLDYGLWLTVRELEGSWLPLVQQEKLDFDGNVRQLIFALHAVGSPEVVRPLARLVRANRVPDGLKESVLTTLVAQGGPPEMDMILEGVLAGSKNSTNHVGLLTALERAARQRQVYPSGNLERLRPLLESSDDSLRAVAMRLAGLCKVEGLRPQMTVCANSNATPKVVRQAALEGLVLLGGAKSRAVLEELGRPGQAPDQRRMAIAGLVEMDVTAGARQAAELLSSGPDAGTVTALMTTLLQQRSGAEAISKSLARRKLPPAVARVAQQTVRASGRDVSGLLTALSQAGGLMTGPRILSPAEMKKMVAAVAEHGDPARGEALYRRKDLTCLKCHAIAGAGGQVGPDLVSIGASAQVDYLIESILQPNKVVKENYHALSVATKEGRVFTGIKVREANGELVLRDGEDKEIAIPVAAIEERTMGGSLMPDGLTDSLTDAELVDLVRFLSELGKIGPYAVSKARLVRRWQVLDPTPEAQYYLHRSTWTPQTLDHPPLNWLPAYSQVDGNLPLAAIVFFPSGPSLPFKGEIGLVRCQLNLASGGKIKIRLNTPTDLELWVDKVPTQAQAEMVLDLAGGLHTLTFAVHADRHEPFRCELEDVPGSPAHGQFVGGK
jgi:putative heme-binding domain-containing protein